jgi:hypothetical protein
VFRLGDSDQVLGAVICLASVDVVDAVPGRDGANLALINKGMFPGIAMIGTGMIAGKHHPVTPPIEVAATLPIRVGTSFSGSMSLTIEARPAAIPIETCGSSRSRRCRQAASTVTDARHLDCEFRRGLDSVISVRPCCGARAGTEAPTEPSLKRRLANSTRCHAASIPPLSTGDK